MTTSTSFLNQFLSKAPTPEIEAAQAQLEAAQAQAAAAVQQSIKSEFNVVWILCAIGAGMGSFSDRQDVQNGYVIGQIQKVEVGDSFLVLDDESESGWTEMSSREISGLNGRLEISNDKLRQITAALTRVDPGTGAGYARSVPCMVKKECSFTGSYANTVNGVEETALVKLTVVDVDTDAMVSPTLEIRSAARGLELARKSQEASQVIRQAGLSGLAARQQATREAKRAAMAGTPNVSAGVQAAVDAAESMDDI